MILLTIGLGVALALLWAIPPTLFGHGVAALYRTLEKLK